MDRVYARQSPSCVWKRLCDCFLPIPIITQVKWSDAFDLFRMEQGEKPMKFFSGADMIARVFASHGVQISVRDVNRKLVRVLAADYEMGQRAHWYRGK